MAQRETSDRDNLPFVNQYFAQTSESRSNFFDDISSNGDGSPFMRSVIASNSSNDLLQTISNSNATPVNISVNAENVENTRNTIPVERESQSVKEEPVVCRLFSSQENMSKQPDGGSARDFFDMIGSPTAGGMSSVKSNPSLQIDYGLGLSSGPNSVLQASDFNQGSKFSAVL